MMTQLPPRAGVGLKAEHARSILESKIAGLWLEIHPENYMIAGGPRLRWLEALRERHALSFHGVGASLGGPEPLDPDHLTHLKRLIERFQPASVSEHATWSALDGRYHPDLFPLPRTQTILSQLCANIDAFQSAIGRTILIENPSVYTSLKAEMDEPAFLNEVCARTGCGLLLDVNNIFVSAANTSVDPSSDTPLAATKEADVMRRARAYIDAIDGPRVGEIHLAGHVEDDALAGLLIDTHGAPICEAVWSLYNHAVDRIGTRPTVIERDNNIPPFDVLMQERDRADATLLREGHAA